MTVGLMSVHGGLHSLISMLVVYFERKDSKKWINITYNSNLEIIGTFIILMGHWSMDIFIRNYYLEQSVSVII